MTSHGADSANKDSLALFNAFVQLEVRSGVSVLFWEDAWINGLTAAAIAPSVVLSVRPAVQRRRSVMEGLAGNSWTIDIFGTLTIEVVTQFCDFGWQFKRQASPQMKGQAGTSFAGNGAETACSRPARHIACFSMARSACRPRPSSGTPSRR
jgi:hypothetical protein